MILGDVINGNRQYLKANNHMAMFVVVSVSINHGIRHFKKMFIYMTILKKIWPKWYTLFYYKIIKSIAHIVSTKGS